MTDTDIRPTSFKLSDEHRARLAAVADRLAARLGVPVTSSAALRRLIDEAFFSTDCSSERSASTERNAA